MKVWSSAYITVEAAFIVPIALGIVFTMMYASFIIHDKAWLSMEADRILEKESRQYANGSDGWNEEQVIQELKDNCGRHMFLLRVEEAECDYNGIAVSIDVTAEARVSLGIVNMIKSLSGSCVFNQKVMIPNYGTALRLSEVINNK